MARHKKREDKEEKEYRRAKAHLNLSKETKRGIAVVIFVVLAILSILSLAHLAGTVGDFLLTALTSIFGTLAYLVPVLFLLVAIALYKQDLEGDRREQSFYLRTYLGALLLTGAIAGLIHIFYLSNDLSAYALAGE